MITSINNNNQSYFSCSINSFGNLNPINISILFLSPNSSTQYQLNSNIINIQQSNQFISPISSGMNIGGTLINLNINYLPSTIYQGYSLSLSMIINNRNIPFNCITQTINYISCLTPNIQNLLSNYPVYSIIGLFINNKLTMKLLPNFIYYNTSTITSIYPSQNIYKGSSYLLNIFGTK